MKKVILLLLLGAWVFTSVAQEKVFQVNEVSVINYGDGRLLFRELNDMGNTIVMITHDLGVAQSAKRIVRIVDGQLQE